MCLCVWNCDMFWICFVGKTFQAIAVADFYRDDWPLLIVTTATARNSWERHLKDLLPSVPADSIQCLATSNDYIGDCKVLITSYSLMDKNADRLTEKHFGFVILVNKSASSLVMPFHLIKRKIINIFRMNLIQLKISKQKVLTAPLVYAKRQNESFCSQVK